MFRTVFSLAHESKRTKTILFSMLAFFFALCLFTSFYYNNSLLLGSLEKFDNDDVKYLRSAQTLLQTGKLTYNYPPTPTCFIMPGIVLIITPFVALFGLEGAIIPIRILFALLQTVSLLMIFLIAKKVCNSKVGLFAVLLSILYLPNVYVSTLILTEAPSHLLILMITLFILHGTEQKKKRYFIVGGILWGLAVMFRSTLAAFPLVVFIYWLIKKYKFGEMVKFGLCALIPFLVILAPWAIRNYVVFDKFVPLTYASGNPAWQGTVINYDWDRLNKEVMPYIQTDDIPPNGVSEIQDNEAETLKAQRIFAYTIKNNPAEYIYWYTIGKTLQNINFPFLWKPILIENFAVMAVWHWVILLVALYGVISKIIKKKFTHEMWFLFTMFWFFNCIHLPFFCFSRYMYPAMFIPIIAFARILAESRLAARAETVFMKKQQSKLPE